MAALLAVAASMVLALSAVIHLSMHHRLKPRINWHRVGFAGALFWIWYLAPRLTDDSVLGSVLARLKP